LVIRKVNDMAFVLMPEGELRKTGKMAELRIIGPFGEPEEAMMAIELEEVSMNFGGGVMEYLPGYYKTA
jgi:hypothetical protein